MELKSYSKKELAIAYSPDITVGAAVNKLMTWIGYNKELTEKLPELGYRKMQKVFTKRMVEEISYYLGEPKGDAKAQIHRESKSWFPFSSKISVAIYYLASWVQWVALRAQHLKTSQK